MISMIPYLILAIEDDDDRAFMTNLYMKYHLLLYKEILEITHNRWDTEDLMQSVLVKLIDRIDILRKLSEHQLIAYICKAARHIAFNHCRDDKSSFFVEVEPENTASQYNTEDLIIKKEQMANLLLVWDTLDENTKYLLSARYILNKSGKEIAEDLKIPPNNVRMAIVRAKRKALRAMKEREEKVDQTI